MRSFTQASFQPPASSDIDEEEPLYVHRPTTAAKTREIFVLVHGLGGKRYGVASTWRKLPEFLFEDFSEVEIGLYGFRSLFGRLTRLFRSVSVAREIEVLADQLRALRQYHSVYLVGHSLGGVLAMGAINHLKRTSAEESLARVKGLLLLAAPQLGSVKVWGPIQYLSHDFRALKVHSDIVAEVMFGFTNDVHYREDAPSDDRIHIPTYALLGDADFWVDQLSASAFLPAAQRRLVRGTHTSICKPHSKDSDAYHFIRESLSRMRNPAPEGLRAEDDIREATPADLSETFELATRYFGSDSSTVARIREWTKKNRRIMLVIRRRSGGGGRARNRVVGYYCVFPITERAGDRIRRGEMSVGDLTVDDILGPVEQPKTIYIGGVVATDKVASGGALGALRQRIADAAASGPVRILTRPATADGLRLVERYGFACVSGQSGIGALYELIWDSD